MLETRGVIRKISDKGAEGLFVSLPGHDGYFRVPAGDDYAALRAQIAAARDENREIRFEYDAELTIISLK
jgi:hypothetical protein